jgi:phage shock protein E
MTKRPARKSTHPISSLIIFVFTSVFLSACSASDTLGDPIKVINVDAAVEAVNNGMIVIDVRSDDEWNAGHLQVAQHIPMSNLDEGIATSKLDKQQPILLYCGSGSRATRASKQFASAGFNHIFVLKPGGYADLSNVGLATQVQKGQ